MADIRLVEKNKKKNSGVGRRTALPSMAVLTVVLSLFALSLLIGLVVERALQSRAEVAPARFTCCNRLRVRHGFVPLTGPVTGSFSTTPEGMLVTKSGGLYEAYLWASCSLGSGGMGSEATVRFTLEGNSWYQSLYRPQGAAHYVNFSAVGLLHLKAGQPVALECRQVDGVSEVFLDAVDLKLTRCRLQQA